MKTPGIHVGSGGFFRLLFFVLLFVAGPTAMADDTYDLVFEGDAGFNGPHGDQVIQVALVDADSGDVVATDSSTVFGNKDPAFSFTFSDDLKSGTHYEVHYWIDSNFDGGNAGRCDPMEHDHQWRVELGMVDDDITHTEDHAPDRMADVCATFEEV